MTKHPFKTAGIPRTGFEYQDLICIDVLLRFYRDPDLYLWVEIESDEPRVGKLDDIVAARKDDSYELLQVKFTADPREHLLDWHWLLHKRKKGTSLIQKWADALRRVEALGRVHSAKLRTNRIPSTAFKASLSGGFVDLDKVTCDQKREISNQLGGDTAAEFFFKNFEFAHSEALIDDLEARLKGQIVPSDTDDRGWLCLREQARRWATRKNSPEPDGRILYEHLVQIITKSRPKPIPQDFAVPEFYEVPSKEFHDDFLERITNPSYPISILWGSPGRGKSTYLSFLVHSLADNDQPAVRHHYFLSLDDRTADRVSFTEICHSIMDQIKRYYPNAVRGMRNAPEHFRNWLEACGKHFASQGKTFYVVIDGLDHVWREHQSNASQMAHLFNHLLPCPDNVSLVIGTQKVPLNQLPLRLVRQTTDDDWVEIPPMDRNAVHVWLDGQHSAGRLLLRDATSFPLVTQLSNVSEAFFTISNGNPLHLIYSFESLVRRGAVFTADEVLSLPACPEGDIRKYYRGLWSRLSSSAQKVIHVIAGSDFHWPPDGLRKCAGSLDEVDHLLEHRRTGLAPFHGSILAYAREQSDHGSTFHAALPAIIRWLKHDALEYWRWAWLWVMEAKSGDASPLLQSTTRQWVIQSLAKGWPADQVVEILGFAEREAFAQNDFVRTQQIRSLKIRVMNGQDYQTDRFQEFHECAVRVAGNEQQILNLADRVPTSNSEEIVTLLRCLKHPGSDAIGSECCEELQKQVNLWIRKRNQTDEGFFLLVDNFLEGLVECGKPDIKRILPFIAQFPRHRGVFNTLLRHIVRTKNFDVACELYSHLHDRKYDDWRIKTENTLVRIACDEGIDLTLRIRPTNEISPLLSCWYRLKGQTTSQPCALRYLSFDTIERDHVHGPNVPLQNFLHSFFFLALDTALHADGECVPALPGIVRSKLGWLRKALDHLWAAAVEMARSPKDIGFDSVFIGLADLAPVDMRRHPSDPSAQQYRALRAVIGRIAGDLHALKCAVSGPSLVDAEAFTLARASLHWADKIWIEQELENRWLGIDPAGVEALVNQLEEEELNSISEFNERTDCWIDLGLISLLYGIKNAERYVSRAANCVVGYGWRKDIWIFDVLSAVKSIHDAGVADAQAWLEALAPVIAEITNFTDGAETNHAPVEFIDIVAEAKPEWLAYIYAHYIAAEDYRYAEKAFSAILEKLDLNNAASVSLVNSLVEESDLRELEKLCRSGRPGAPQLLRRRKAFLGVVASRKKFPKTPGKKSRQPKDDLDGWRGTPPDVSKFAPNELEKLLDRIESPRLGYRHRDQTLINWLRHWDKNNQGLSALKAIDEYLHTHDSSYPVLPLLDGAFEVSMKHEGRRKAYRWLVRAHTEQHGWDSYWDSRGRATRRLGLAATHYQSKWNEFIHDTSKPPIYRERKSPNFAIGTQLLVKYLLLVKQTDLAVQLTASMVQQTLEEVSDQPIPAIGWLSRC